MSKEHKAAISAAMKGRRKSGEQKRKIAEGVRRTRSVSATGPKRRYFWSHVPKFPKIPRPDSYKSVVVVAVVLLPLLIIGLTNFGLFTQPDWSVKWEAMKEITVDSNVEWVNAQLVFGQFRPDICQAGIEVRGPDDGNVSFETYDEVYRDGVCAESGVRFRNDIYSLPGPMKITFVEPTPEDNSEVSRAGSW